MTYKSHIASQDRLFSSIEVRQIDRNDLRQALKMGAADFFDSPTHPIFLTAIYLIVAALVALFGLGENPLPLLFPLVAGMALIGPLAACGIYELSRRKELGLNYAWWHAFDVLSSPSRAAILLMGAMLALLFFCWMQTAVALYGAYFGDLNPGSLSALMGEVFTTAAGWQLLISGCAIGLLYSVVVFVMTVVSLPAMIDRPMRFSQAVGLSLKACLRNWQTLMLWYVMVAALMSVGVLTFFFGLAILLPIVGHASWHLYRMLVKRPGELR